MKMEPAGELMGYMNTILKKENGRMVFPWDTFISLGMPMEDWRHMKLVHGPFTMLEKLKGFIKGAIGAHFSSLKRSGPLGELSDNDFGFAGGAGLGGSYFINEKIFLNAEYELLWLSNAYYVEGLLNTASLGIGFRF